MSKQRKKRKSTPTGADATLVANILGQFCYAFGQGAGSVHVMREAIQALRHRYEPYIAAATPNGDDALWVEQGIHVLEYMRAEGRMAANLVSDSGRWKITRRDFLKAARTVERHARHNPKADTGPLSGEWCPP